MLLGKQVVSLELCLRELLKGREGRACLGKAGGRGPSNTGETRCGKSLHCSACTDHFATPRSCVQQTGVACGSQLVLRWSALVALVILGSRSNIFRDKGYGSIEVDVLKVARVETHASLHI